MFLLFALLGGLAFGLIPLAGEAEVSARTAPSWRGGHIRASVALVGFRLRLGRFPGPVWIGCELQVLVKRIQRGLEALEKDLEKTGRIQQAPPVTTFPHWARCQEIAQKYRPDMLVVRMNLAALKAAGRILKGSFDDDHEDRLGQDLPGGFSPGDWGEEILRDFRMTGLNKAQRLRLVKRAEGEVRTLFMDLRDEVNRDAVWAHHKWERSRGGGDPLAVNRAAWSLWIALGCPERW